MRGKACRITASAEVPGVQAVAEGYLGHAHPSGASGVTARSSSVWKHLGLFPEGGDRASDLVSPRPPLAAHPDQPQPPQACVPAVFTTLVGPLDAPRRLRCPPLSYLGLAVWTVIRVFWPTKCHLETFRLK